MLPDTVSDFKRLCLFEFVVKQWGHTFGGKIVYENSIARSDEKSYSLVTYGKSTIFSNCCNDLIFFQFSGMMKKVFLKCANQSCRQSAVHEATLDSQIYKTIFGVPDENKAMSVLNN